MTETELKGDIQAETAKLEAAAAADVAKIKSVWHSHTLYFVAFGAFAVGIVLGHILK